MRRAENDGGVYAEKRWRLCAFVLTTLLTLALGCGAALASTKLSLPAGTKIVEKQAFYGNTSLDTLVFPYGTEQILSKSFAMSGVKTVYFTETVTFIADDAFDETSITKVYAEEGTYAYDWAAAKGYRVIDRSNPASDFDYYFFNGTYVISGYKGESATVIIPHVIDGYPVRTIGYSAFANNETITSVTIPNSATGISSFAFDQCKALKSVQIPDSVTSMGQCAFRGCASLKAVELPSALLEIPYFAFADCTALKQVVIPEGVTALKEYAFSACAALKEISIPKTVTSIGDRAFYQCKGLKNVTLDSGVTEIGYGAFQYCSSIERIDFPDSLVKIDSYAFASCASLKSITLRQGIGEIGRSAFQFCGSMEGIVLPDSVTTLGTYAFYYCSALKSAVLSAGLTAIPECTFYYDTALESVTIPDSVTTIGDSAFYACGIKEVILPSRLESIKGNAFYNSKLEYVAFPKKIAEIEDGAFSRVTCKMEFTGAAPTFNSLSFNGATIIAIYPHGKSGWSAAVKEKYGASSINWIDSTQASGEVKDTARDKTETLAQEETTNQNFENYYTWNSPIRSYLVAESDGGFTRVEYVYEASYQWTQDESGTWSRKLVSETNKVYIERYNKNNKLTWKKSLDPELSLWGGFFSGEKYNFFVYGQTNWEEDDNREVVRVVRYTKNWHRVDSVSVYGANTVVPFNFGSLSMSEAGDYLYIHTCHQMYKSSDGKNHQANMNYEIYVPYMVIIRGSDLVSNSYYDYVSHSFNQLVIVDGDDVVKVDHGDGYPRSITLYRVAGSASTLGYGTTSRVALLQISGTTGYNYTGASVGGLQASTTSYLVAGNSIDQSKFGSSTRRNIFVAAANKADLSADNVTFRWITSYEESDTRSVSTPLLVKISGSKFLLMWTETQDSATKVRYTFLNQNGTRTTKIYSAEGQLSDCQPVVTGNTVTWYVTSKSTPVFYYIDLNDPGKINKKN